LSSGVISIALINYFTRLAMDLRLDRAMQLIQDIRLKKKQGKDNARDIDGWIDRTRKLAGFVVEGLFMHPYFPIHMPT
jgi:hypothetical protein